MGTKNMHNHNVIYPKNMMYIKGGRGETSENLQSQDPSWQQNTPTTVPLVVHITSALTHFILPNCHAKDNRFELLPPGETEALNISTVSPALCMLFHIEYWDGNVLAQPPHSPYNSNFKKGDTF
jgi:hypothetical protein